MPPDEGDARERQEVEDLLALLAVKLESLGIGEEADLVLRHAVLANIGRLFHLLHDLAASLDPPGFTSPSRPALATCGPPRPAALPLAGADLEWGFNATSDPAVLHHPGAADLHSVSVQLQALLANLPGHPTATDVQQAIQVAGGSGPPTTPSKASVFPGPRRRPAGSAAVLEDVSRLEPWAAADASLSGCTLLSHVVRSAAMPHGRGINLSGNSPEKWPPSSHERSGHSRHGVKRKLRSPPRDAARPFGVGPYPPYKAHPPRHVVEAERVELRARLQELQDRLRRRPPREAARQVSHPTSSLGWNRSLFEDRALPTPTSPPPPDTLPSRASPPPAPGPAAPPAPGQPARLASLLSLSLPTPPESPSPKFAFDLQPHGSPSHSAGLPATPQAPTQEGGVGAAWTTSPYRPEEDRRYSIDSIELPSHISHSEATATPTHGGGRRGHPTVPTATSIADTPPRTSAPLARLPASPPQPSATQAESPPKRPRLGLSPPTLVSHRDEPSRSIAGHRTQPTTDGSGTSTAAGKAAPRPAGPRHAVPESPGEAKRTSSERAGERCLERHPSPTAERPSSVAPAAGSEAAATAPSPPASTVAMPPAPAPSLPTQAAPARLGGAEERSHSRQTSGSSSSSARSPPGQRPSSPPLPLCPLPSNPRPPTPSDPPPALPPAPLPWAPPPLIPAPLARPAALSSIGTNTSRPATPVTAVAAPLPRPPQATKAVQCSRPASGDSTSMMAQEPPPPPSGSGHSTTVAGEGAQAKLFGPVNSWPALLTTPATAAPASLCSRQSTESSSSPLTPAQGGFAPRPGAWAPPAGPPAPTPRLLGAGAVVDRPFTTDPLWPVGDLADAALDDAAAGVTHGPDRRSHRTASLPPGWQRASAPAAAHPSAGPRGRLRSSSESSRPPRLVWGAARYLFQHSHPPDAAPGWLREARQWLGHRLDPPSPPRSRDCACQTVVLAKARSPPRLPRPVPAPRSPPQLSQSPPRLSSLAMPCLSRRSLPVGGPAPSARASAARPRRLRPAPPVVQCVPRDGRALPPGTRPLTIYEQVLARQGVLTLTTTPPPHSKAPRLPTPADAAPTDPATTTPLDASPLAVTAPTALPSPGVPQPEFPFDSTGTPAAAAVVVDVLRF